MLRQQNKKTVALPYPVFISIDLFPDRIDRLIGKEKRVMLKVIFILDKSDQEL